VGSSALISQSYDPGSAWASDNTAVGYNALTNNQPVFTVSSGTANTAVGSQALQTNTIGYDNTASGFKSLYSNTIGFDNTASGDQSLYANTQGLENTAIGGFSLYANTLGNENTAVGYNTGQTNTTGTSNTFVGFAADAAANNLINATALGYLATVNASNKVRIGNSSVSVIEGQVAWSFPSDVRLKENIRDLDLGLDFVMQLRPVSFTMKQGNGRTDMGFLAQDVEALLGDGYNVLGIGGDKDRTLSLRGNDLIAPLVKAFQEQQAQIESRDARIAGLEARLAALEARLAGK
jgi:trimeric autotransporter adhesin